MYVPTKGTTPKQENGIYVNCKYEITEDLQNMKKNVLTFSRKKMRTPPWNGQWQLRQISLLT